MSYFFVAGGTYQNPSGRERFDLVGTGPGEPPFVMMGGIMSYFNIELIWQNAHLYRVEEDFTLALIVSSPEALDRGVKAPPRVIPDSQLLFKLRIVIKHNLPSANPDEVSFTPNPIF